MKPLSQRIIESFVNESSTLTIQDYEMLKNSKDAFEFHLIGKNYYKAGSNGLSKYDKKFNEIGHCNDFRNKSYKDAMNELNMKNKE